jgi:MFS family permease
MNTKLERNLKLMMLQSIFLEPLFWGPILILTLQNLAYMKLEDIYLQESICVVLCLVIDIPTGALADIMGRKKMLVIGQILGFADFMIFAFMSEPWHTWVANILWAIGAAFRSGADKALIQESCIALGKDRGYYRTYAGKASGLRFLMFAIAAPVTSYIAEYNLRLPLMLCIPFLAIPLVCVFMLTEPPRDDVRELTVKQHVLQMKEGIRDTYRNKRILWIMLYLCVVTAVSKIWFFAYNPYFEHVGLPVRYFGWIFLTLNVVAWLTSQYGRKVEAALGDKLVVKLLIPLIGVPIILMSAIPIPAMAFLVIFQNIVRGMNAPFFDSMSEQYLRSSTRATVLSVQSSVTSAMGSVCLLGFSFLIKPAGLLASMCTLGALTLIAYMVLMKYWKKCFE